MTRPTLAALRRYTVARSLRPAPSLPAAITALGFVQADPIRAPARAQDLILRHRAPAYRAGDLERQYPALDVEEDFFVNYGFLPRDVYALMHPRSGFRGWPRPGPRTARRVLAFVQARGEAHPRDVEAALGGGAVTNYWGGSSAATTHLLDHLHYRGLLRIRRRDSGIRVYVPQTHPPPVRGAARLVRLDALIDVFARTYAPLPSATLGWLVARLRYATPQWQGLLRDALARAKRRFAHAEVDGVVWYWPAGDALPAGEADERVRLLAPFDPVVWDRRRFERLWGWAYRFEAYTPVARRRLGYYALPLLWRDHVIGWANVAWRDGVLDTTLGYVAGRPPRSRAFTAALDRELEDLREFLRSRDDAA